MAITLREIAEEDLELIMKWRMSEDVTKYMNTNPKLTIEGQKKWLSSTRNRNDVRNWIIEVEGVPAGLINLINIDWKKKTTSWGYYIGEKHLRSLKLAISLEMSLYDYCFDVLDFKEVNSETFKENTGVWKLHIACGCSIAKEVAGEIEKEGKQFDVMHMTIRKEDWLSIRESKKYESIDFDIFKDETDRMVVHHIGIAVADINKSIDAYCNLGWELYGKIIKDIKRGVYLAFVKRKDAKDILELVSSIGEDSPVSNLIKENKGIATPYHICYTVRDIDKAVEVLKKHRYILVEKAQPAVAFDNRYVAFMLNRDVGLIELLEERDSE